MTDRTSSSITGVEVRGDRGSGPSQDPPQPAPGLVGKSISLTPPTPNRISLTFVFVYGLASQRPSVAPVHLAMQGCIVVFERQKFLPKPATERTDRPNSQAPGKTPDGEGRSHPPPSSQTASPRQQKEVKKGRVQKGGTATKSMFSLVGGTRFVDAS